MDEKEPGRSESLKGDLCCFIDSSFKNLETIWLEVGYSEEEKDTQTLEIKQKMYDVLKRHSEHQNELKLQMREQIRKTVGEIRDFRKRLRYSIEDQQSVKEPEEGSLVLKLDALMQDADEVRQKVEYRGTVLDQCRERITYIQQKLGRELEIEYIDTMKDMSLERVDKFQKRVTELEEELTAKQGEAEVLLSDFCDLLEELGYTPDTLQSPLDKKVSWWKERQQIKRGALTVVTADFPPVPAHLERTLSTVSERNSSGSEGSRKRERNSDRPRSWSPTTPTSSAPRRPCLPPSMLPPPPVLGGPRPSSCQSHEDFPFDLSPEGMTIIMDRLSSLKKEKDQRLEYFEQRQEEIRGLWERLKVPESEREAFCAKVQNTGFSLRTVEMAEHELASLQLLKKEMMGSIIEELRQEIRMMWMEMSTSQQEQKSFGFMHVPPHEYNDDVLTQHENEVQRLQEQLEEMRPLFKRITMREELLVERAKLVEIQKDSSRLSSRDPNAMRQRKDEMAMERRVTRLPKLTETLRKKLEEWEKTNGPFLVDGDNYLEKLEESEREWAQGREADKERKEAQRRQERERTVFGALSSASSTPARAMKKRGSNSNSNKNLASSKSQREKPLNHTL